MENPTTTEERDQQPSTDPLGTPQIIESTIAASDVTNTEPPAEPDISNYRGNTPVPVVCSQRISKEARDFSGQ